MDVLTKPLSKTKIKKLSKNGKEYVTGLVSMDLSDLIDNDFESILDIMSNLLIGSDLLMDVNYEIHSASKDTLVMEITGDVSGHLECYD